MSGVRGSLLTEAVGAFVKRGHHHPWTHQLWGGSHQVGQKKCSSRHREIMLMSTLSETLFICITVYCGSSQKVLACPATLTWTLPVYIFRLEQGENLEENQRNLLQITERFFQAIIGSSSEFPPQLRSVCHCLYQVGLPLSIMGSPAAARPAFPPSPLCGQHHVHILHEVSLCCSTCCSKHHTHQLHVTVQLHPVSVSQFPEALWDAELLSDSQTGLTFLAFAIITVKFFRGKKCKIMWNTEGFWFGPALGLSEI